MGSQRVRHDWVTNTHNLYTISLPQGPLFWSVKSHFPLQVQLLAHSALSSQFILCWRLLAALPSLLPLFSSSVCAQEGWLMWTSWTGFFCHWPMQTSTRERLKVGEGWSWSIIPPVPYLSVTRTECGQKPSLSLGCFLQRANHHLWVPLTIFSCWLFRTRGGNSSHVLLKLVHSLKKLIQFECAMSSSALTLSNVPSSHSK